MPPNRSYRVPTCLDCENEIDPNGNGTWVLVQGWAQNRAVGGTNALKDRISLKQFLCDRCMKERGWNTTHQSSKLF